MPKLMISPKSSNVETCRQYVKVQIATGKGGPILRYLGITRRGGPRAQPQSELHSQRLAFDGSLCRIN
jgi:hypothetical protein